MKKIILTIILTLFMVSSVFAEWEITHKIPDNLKASFIENYVSVHKNTAKILDPACTQQQIDEGNCPIVLKRTDEEHVIWHSGDYFDKQGESGSRKATVDTAKQNHVKKQWVTSSTAK